MGRQPASESVPCGAPHIGAQSSRHLLSTYFITAWVIFIIVTIVIHEIAHRAARDYYNSLYLNLGFRVPWVYRHGTGLPSLLRTAFAQVHGPITAMHLTRLAVNTLECSWSSPKTWMEALWLADRRWAGPFGLGKTCWTIASRRLRVSPSFIILAGLNIIALATPIVMTRAYFVATDDLTDGFLLDVSMVDLPTLARLSPEIQIETGNEIWNKGLSPVLMFPENTYTMPAAYYSSQDSWFFTGESYSAESSLAGILVEGGCWGTARSSDAEMLCTDLPVLGWEFNRECTELFYLHLWLIHKSATVTDLSQPSGSLAAFSITSGSSCSNIELGTPFGQIPALPAQRQPHKDLMWRGTHHEAVFQIQSSKGNFTARCDASAAPGIASVDGRHMTFKHFTYTSPNFSEPISREMTPIHPLAAIMHTDGLSLQHSVNLKLDRVFRTLTPVNELEYIVAESLWEGILAMSAATWIETALPAEAPAISRTEATGIRRDTASFCALIALLGIWFVGMISVTVVLLRPAWTASLDGYAAARILRHQTAIIQNPEAWLLELDENSDLLASFTPEQCRCSRETVVSRVDQHGS